MNIFVLSCYLLSLAWKASWGDAINDSLGRIRRIHFAQLHRSHTWPHRTSIVLANHYKGNCTYWHIVPQVSSLSEVNYHDNTIPVRYLPKVGVMTKREKGSLLAHETGVASAYGIEAAQERGRLFIGPKAEVYENMIIGVRPVHDWQPSCLFDALRYLTDQSATWRFSYQRLQIEGKLTVLWK